MGAIGSTLGKMISNASGQPVHSSLEDFLSFFNSPSGAYSRTLDPMTTFDVEFNFHPNLDDAGLSQDDGGSKLVKGFTSALKQAGKNALDNITGGLTGSLFSSDYKSARQEYSKANIGKVSVLEYMIKANGFEQMNQFLGDGSDSDALRLQLGLFI